MANNIVDARGRSCPEPVIMTQQAIKEMTSNQEITVLVSEEVAKENVSRTARNSGCDVEVEDSSEGYKLLITKR
ncbi:MAG: sulfurtransferase TusA family protein [Bacillota bacterium]